MPSSALLSPMKSPSFSPFSETLKIRTLYGLTFEIYHYGCQFCNGLTPETCRNEARIALVGVEFLGGEHRAPSSSARRSGKCCKLPQRGPGRSPGKFAFRNIFGPRKSRQNGQLAFESGGGEVNLGRGTCPPLPQRRSAPADGRTDARMQDDFIF